METYEYVCILFVKVSLFEKNYAIRNVLDIFTQNKKDIE